MRTNGKNKRVNTDYFPADSLYTGNYLLKFDAFKIRMRNGEMDEFVNIWSVPFGFIN